ncbi:MAG: RecQ family ATP-dependent DNA helicase, partial [Chloroflexota bacterium]|nr:RecQ family ATP-dependent DNA helicase [Chloroflexota bacterium]
QEIVQLAVEGRDTLALMPTGAGKSLCYQLAAMLRPTPTLVISPLIALMKDQVDHLPAAVAARASLINSSLDPVEAARRLEALASGQYKLIYAAPERLRQRQFVSALRSVQVGLVVIDEVHCVSMWGHDFRPDYLFIGPALRELGDPAVLGLTATATPETQRDIGVALGRDLEVVRTSVVRPNLRYEVEHVTNEEARLRTTLERVRALGGTGIVYARAREKCEQLARLLAQNGVRALHYHAGLESHDRSRVQEAFVSDEARVIVATTAFGMGIDKRDIRWIVLYNYPNSLESYVQMVGRAGRDGQPSTCILMASAADASSLRRFARTDIPSLDDLRAVYRALRSCAQNRWAELAPEELASLSGPREGVDARVLVGMLERAGLVRRDMDAARALRVEILPPPADAGQRIATLLATYERQARARADRIVAFAQSSTCRHQQLAQHFGESISVPCGQCDVCAPDPSRAADTRAEPAVQDLPRDIAGTIVQAVRALEWPLGQKGLVALLRGSVASSPSARRHPSYGVLSGASDGAVRRWITQLVDEGCLAQFESVDGYRLLRVGAVADLPQIQPAERKPARKTSRRERVRVARISSEPIEEHDPELFEALRAWRLERAREEGVPPYVVMHDSVLRELARLRPRGEEELSQVKGMGPAKVGKYGAGVLDVLARS